MTGHPARLDLTRRRQVDRLRTELDLKSVAPHIGSQLRALIPLVRAELAQRLPEEELLVAALARVAEEFTSIVENRPLTAPPAEVLLAGAVLDAGPAGSATADLGLDTLRELMREQWTRLSHGDAHAARLEEALARYVARLRDRVRRTRLPRRDRPLAHVDSRTSADLLVAVERRWGSAPVQLCVMVGAQAMPDRPAPATPRARSAVRGERPRALQAVAADHVIVVTERWAPAPLSPRQAPAPGGAVWVGPVTADQVSTAYETALLRHRLVRAGVAAPPPALLPLPDLGFLHLTATDTTVDRIAELLRPLTGQTDHRRVALARTMQTRLRRTGTVLDLAGRLGVHPQTVRNHLHELRRLYGHDLDEDDTLVTLAALALVLPLWELEDGVPPPGRARPENSPQIAPLPSAVP